MALPSSCFSQPLSSSSLSMMKRSVLAKSYVKTLSLSKTKSKMCIDSSKIRFNSPWGFIGGSRIDLLTNVSSNSSSVNRKKVSGVRASWIDTSHIANNAFAVGTMAVLPFYALMVLAPKAIITKKCMESSIPYTVLSVLYAYILYLSWTPDTLKYIFSSQVMSPELSGISKLFSSEMSLTSAWIHILLVDLFAARLVFKDGLENKIETRHSVLLCLLACPVGLVSHLVTKALTTGITLPKRPNN